MAKPRVLSYRVLNRALLARQLLLEPSALRPDTAIEHLVGLQAQAPLPPYLALRARLRDFDPHEVGRMISDRALVRLTLMRGTIHMVTPRDAAFLRPLVQVVIERTHNGAFGRRMGGAEAEQISRAVAEELRAGPLGARELGRRLVARGIGEDAEAIGNAARVHAALVQVPPRGVWGTGGRARYLAFQDWTGLDLEPDPPLERLVRRYLVAFGPASVKDMQNWSGLTKLAPVFERMRAELAIFADEEGHELFDLPDAPRPAAEVPAGVHFLGEYDNLLLGHDDRRRVIPDGFPWRDVVTGDRFVNFLLVDGMLRATWWIEREGRRLATLAIRPSRELAAPQREQIELEARATLELLATDAERRAIRVEAAVGS